MRKLNGLILIGGKSRRMGKDKAQLHYHGRTQLEVTLELLQPFCDHVFVSKREDQSLPEGINAAVINDAVDGHGPLIGILSAFKHQPECAWLVVACDLPFLNEETLQYLGNARDVHKCATAYVSTHTGDPEPLCTIYEPSIAGVLTSNFENGRHCPRHILKENDIKLIHQQDTIWLENVNTPEEYEQAQGMIK